MLFKTMLNQFHGCIKLEIKKCLAISRKFRNSTKNKLDMVLVAIKQVSAAHNEMLKGICGKIIRGLCVELFSTSLPETRQIIEQRQAA